VWCRRWCWRSIIVAGILLLHTNVLFMLMLIRWCLKKTIVKYKIELHIFVFTVAFNCEGVAGQEAGFSSNFPHCIGAIDGKHIILQCPAHSGPEYYNYKRTLVFYC
jgi:hypothetical protein